MDRCDRRDTIRYSSIDHNDAVSYDWNTVRTMQDQDVEMDQIWNNYLKKYRKDYKIQKDEAGVWTIRCKYGNIQPYSLCRSKQLCFVADFNSPRRLSSFVSKTKDLSCKNTQEGYCDMVLVFNEEDLAKFAEVCRIRKKRHIKTTPERRAQLCEQLANARKQKKPRKA